MSKSQNLETKLVHAGRKQRYTQGSVSPVIQRASSLVFNSVKDKKHATLNRYKGDQNIYQDYCFSPVNVFLL